MQGRPISAIPGSCYAADNLGRLEDICSGWMGCFPNPWSQVAQEIGSRGLIRAAFPGRSSNENEKVEEEAKGGDADDDRRDGDIDLPKVARESATEKQQRDLQHHRERFQYRVEVPCDNTVKFSLSVLAAFDG